MYGTSVYVYRPQVVLRFSRMCRQRLCPVQGSSCGSRSGQRRWCYPQSIRVTICVIFMENHMFFTLYKNSHRIISDHCDYFTFPQLNDITLWQRFFYPIMSDHTFRFHQPATGASGISFFLLGYKANVVPRIPAISPPIPARAT